MDGAWPYIPITLMIIAAVIWIARGLSGPPNNPAAPAPGFNQPVDRQPWLTPYLRAFIVMMTVMIIYQFASSFISHLFPPHP